MLYLGSSNATSEAGLDRLRALATNASTVLWNTSPQGELIHRHLSWEAFTGQTFPDYAGWGWIGAVHPDDREATTIAWRTAIESGMSFECNYRLRRHDGQWRQVHAQGTPVLDGEQVREWVGVCVDVTAAHEAEAALRESELRYRFLDELGEATRSLVSSSEVMATTARLLGQYLGATRCAYADVEADGNAFTIRNDWTAQGIASSAGKYSLDLFGPQATEKLRAGRHLVVHDVDQELGQEGGARMFNAIGIQSIICAGLVKQGRLVAMMAVHQSTPRTWSHQDVAVVSEVGDRCWAHIERVRSSAMLLEQDRRKDEFLATLAHELRNPLAPIRYAVATLRHGRDVQRRIKAEDVIDRQVGHMARLIDDLMDVSRINRGLIQLRPSRVMLADVMGQAAEAVRPVMEEAGHTLEVQCSPPDLALLADDVRLVQVLGNLLTNAAKYTPDGGLIRLNGFADSGSAVLEVSDNGVGIRLDQQAFIFEKFTQIQHPASERTQSGLGVGLSLVKELVALHEGTVTVTSQGPGHGSTFRVELPLAPGGPGVKP